MLSTLDELRDNIASVIMDTDTGTLTLIDNALNLTLGEIHHHHPWTWKRRKTTFATVASQEAYNLDEEIDEIALLRDLTNSRKLLYVPDRQFYRYIPDPENTTGTAQYYRRWEETGFSTNLAAADTVYVQSSSTADTTQKVLITGRRSSDGLVVTNSLSLNGTTTVTSTDTFDTDGLMYLSKSASTTGTVTVYRTTGATVLTRIGPNDTAPRYKRIGLYPIPSAVVTIYVEYYERLRYLVNDGDAPQMDSKWAWVLREGALAKMWQYKQKDAMFAASQGLFDRGLKQMVREDDANPDYIPVLEPRQVVTSTVRRVNDSVNNNFPGYALNL